MNDHKTHLISLESYPSAFQGGAWDEALGSLSLSGGLPQDSIGNGDVQTIHSPSGAIFARLRSLPQKILNAATPSTARSHEPLLIIFHQLGTGSIAGRSERQDFAPDDITICNQVEAFTLDMREEFELLMLKMPHVRALSRVSRARTHLPVVLSATATTEMLRALMSALMKNFDAVSRNDLVSAEIAMTELVVGALFSEERIPNKAMTQVQMSHFHRITRAIQTNLVNIELSIADIVRAEGLSQRYIQKLFELQETTFSDYVRQHRLDRAHLELADSAHNHESIAEIAYRWGFRDQAHFSRVFTTTYGESPRAFRHTLANSPQGYPWRGKPSNRRMPNHTVEGDPPRDISCGNTELRGQPASADFGDGSYRIRASKDTVHWGYLSRSIPPVLRVQSGMKVVIETLTQHAFDDYERMIKGDAGAESVFRWTAAGKNVDRRGAGPMDASIFGRGAGEGFGVHICTGPVFIENAEPGDTLEIRIMDIEPRPSANPEFSGRCFASNVSAWWGYQYSDLLSTPKKREVVTIYEVESGGAFARALYSYHWTPQTDPFGVRHDTIDYPGIPVDHSKVDHKFNLIPNVRVPLRPHFGFMAVAPRESDMIDSIPPGYFGGNFDNWRAGKGSTLYLPVAVRGALFSCGDGHLALGDGEINGTALEASLTGKFCFVVHKKDNPGKPWLQGLPGPLLETPREFVLHGFSYPNYLRELGRNAQSEVYTKSSLNRALRSAFHATRRFLMQAFHLSEDEAVSLISVAVDFGVTQVADGNWGVHATIRKSIFRQPGINRT